MQKRTIPGLVKAVGGVTVRGVNGDFMAQILKTNCCVYDKAFCTANSQIRVEEDDRLPKGHCQRQQIQHSQQFSSLIAVIGEWATYSICSYESSSSSSSSSLLPLFFEWWASVHRGGIGGFGHRAEWHVPLLSRKSEIHAPLLRMIKAAAEEGWVLGR